MTDVRCAKIFDQEQFEYLQELSLSVEYLPSGITSKEQGNRVDTEVRNSFSGQIKKHLIADASKTILEFAKELDPKLNHKEYSCHEIEFLRYEKGGFFKKHHDCVLGKDNRSMDRLYTSVTLIDKSDDLVGGDLICYAEDKSMRIGQSVGLTTIFPSYMDHQCTPITQGTRTVLIGWIHKKRVDY